MDVYVFVLRLLHVVGGLFWAGSALYATWFVQPAAQPAFMNLCQLEGHASRSTSWALSRRAVAPDLHYSRRAG